MNKTVLRIESSIFCDAKLVSGGIIIENTMAFRVAFHKKNVLDGLKCGKHVEKIKSSLAINLPKKNTNFSSQSILLFPKSFTESGQGSSRTIPSLVSWPVSILFFSQSGILSPNCASKVG